MRRRPRAIRRRHVWSGGRISTPLGSGGLLIAAVLAWGLPAGLTAANDVTSSRAGGHLEAAGVNDKKPNECNSLTLLTTVEGSGPVTGGSDPELLLGAEAADGLDGGGGDDCLVAGGGADELTGGSGTDVCLGGPGTDSFDATCETQVE